jgi:hypothetical protein
MGVHPYFHRPLSALLGPALEARLVLDAIEECAFPPEHAGGSTPLSWNGVATFQQRSSCA